jgi:hypothetical protein
MDFLLPPSDPEELKIAVSRRLRARYLEKQAAERADGSKIRNFSSYRVLSKYLKERFGYGVRHKSIENYFRGQQKIPIYALIALCEAFDMSVVEAMCGVDPQSEQTMKIVEVLRKMRDSSGYQDDLDPRTRRMLDLFQEASEDIQNLIIAFLTSPNFVKSLEEVLKEHKSTVKDGPGEDKE